ncbi:uncharacterized protein A4U43_C07F36830 [Asparagus officinalis]|uniref:phospholipase A2 n=1 Tax=Asparagus officinalis TaxID=4686 RepID=A0A5P1EHN9_ASPOF|nr:phospholipase A2 homolog 3-like [Asparagus officinalis]ONK65412.1 uncharacterized protein A4U43_C07F36830 [Asparagus officinalis]
MGLKLVFILTLISCLLLVRVHVQALNIGIQSNSDHTSNKQQECSRTCESDHCSAPPFLRYGKYCGFMYSGCPGEKPCDGLDACCMVHDACIQAKHSYVSFILLLSTPIFEIFLFTRKPVYVKF